MARSTTELGWYTDPGPDRLLSRVCGGRPQPEYLARPRFPAPLARRLRLFAVACVRAVWDLLPTDPRSAVILSERYAEGQATLDDLRAAAVRVSSPRRTPVEHAVAAAGFASASFQTVSQNLFWDPAEAARQAAHTLAARRTGSVVRGISDDRWMDAFADARATQANILRDVFPPPDSAVAIDPEWRTSTVLGLARSMEATGDFSAVPILADALQDAGCTDETILNQCRHPGPHVRGNWVVDLVFGR
jgi:hypothetical protein